MSSQISRRRALQWLAALGMVGVGAPSLGKSACAAFAGELDLDAVTALGREYMAAVPDDPEVQVLARLLRNATAEQHEPVLRSRMHEDFATGRIVNLSGWYLSATEARVFAALSACSQDV